MLFLSSAFSHPFGERYAAVSTDVLVEPDQVRVEVVADVPYALADAMVGQGAPRSRLLEILPAQLRIVIDGQERTPTVQNQAIEPDLVTAHADLYRFELTVPTPSPPQEIAVDNGALVATPSWVRAAAWVPSGATVVSYNLSEPTRFGPLDGTWTQSRLARRTQVTLSPTHDPISRTLAVRGPRRGASDVLARTLSSRWWDGTKDRDTLAIVSILAGAWGAASTSLPSPSRRHLVLGLLAGGIVGMGLASGMPDAGPLVALGGAVVAMARPRWRIAVCVAWAVVGSAPIPELGLAAGSLGAALGAGIRAHRSRPSPPTSATPSARDRLPWLLIAVTTAGFGCARWLG